MTAAAGRDEILAARTYTRIDPDETISITVRIGIPRRRDDGRYECQVEIQEPERITSRAVNGEDALEALQLALIMIGVDIQHIDEQIGGGLAWHSTGSDLGLPTYPDFSVMHS